MRARARRRLRRAAGIDPQAGGGAVADCQRHSTRRRHCSDVVGAAAARFATVWQSHSSHCPLYSSFLTLWPSEERFAARKRARTNKLYQSKEIDYRLEVPSSPTEVKDLVTAVNGALGRIESAIRSLRDFTPM